MSRDCPTCGQPTRVLDTREMTGQIMRRRQCPAKHRHTTLEQVAVEIGGHLQTDWERRARELHLMAEDHYRSQVRPPEPLPPTPSLKKAKPKKGWRSDGFQFGKRTVARIAHGEVRRATSWQDTPLPPTIPHRRTCDED